MPLFEIGPCGIQEIPRRNQGDKRDDIVPTTRQEQLADKVEMFWAGFIYGSLWTAFAGTVYFVFFK